MMEKLMFGVIGLLQEWVSKIHNPVNEKISVVQ